MMKKGNVEVLNSSSFDPQFKFEVIRTLEGETTLGCFQCGMCTASCPLSDAVDVKPHQVMKDVLLGMKEEALKCKMIWACSFCLTCNIRCPQGVKPANVMVALKHMSVEQKGIPESLQIVNETIIKEGWSKRITDFQNKRRVELGLPEVPKVNKDLERLLNETGFKEYAGG